MKADRLINSFDFIIFVLFHPVHLILKKRWIRQSEMLKKIMPLLEY